MHAKSVDWNRPVVLALVAILAVAFLLRIGAATALPNLAVSDENDQTREPAHRLVYGYGVITWEWRAGARSWVFPAFLAGVMRATAWMGAGSSGYLLGIAAVLSLISLTAVWFAFLWAYRASGIVAAVIAGGACAIWFELIYYAPKALNEVLAAHLLLPGLYLGAYGESLPERKRLFISGLFCGLALALRTPLAPAVAFAAIYFSRQNWRVRLPAIAAGMLLPVIVFGLVDAATWSYPFQSFILYFWANFVQRNVVTPLFGTSPWYWYLPDLAWRLGPMLVLALVGARRSPFLGWVSLIILLTHSLSPHKEDRYVYPMIPMLITLAALGLVDFVSALHVASRAPRAAIAVIGFSLAFCAAMSAYLGRQFDGWWHDAGQLVVFERLSRDGTVCGVAWRGYPWAYTGGYTHLHRKVPILFISQESDVARLAPAVNAIVTTLPIEQAGFKLTNCRRGVCLYQRPGGCAPAPKEDEINEVLQRDPTQRIVLH